jgi:hypothetical protein
VLSVFRFNLGINGFRPLFREGFLLFSILKTMAKQIKIEFRPAAHLEGVVLLDKKNMQVIAISQLEPEQLKNYIKTNLTGPNPRLTKENHKNLMRYFKNSIAELTTFVENAPVTDNIEKPTIEA